MLFVASLNDRAAGASTLELASRDCVSDLTLICGSTSAIVVGLWLSLNNDCLPLFVNLIELAERSAGPRRKDYDAVLYWLRREAMHEGFGRYFMLRVRS